MIEMSYDYYNLELLEKACKRCTYCIKCSCDSSIPSLACRNDDMIDKYKSIPPHRLITGVKLAESLHVLLTPKMQGACPRNERYRECL